MKLYCTPGGTWAGNEADWKTACKAEGLDPKTVKNKQVDVPTSKAELLEFLTFHGVNPISGRPPVIQAAAVSFTDADVVAAAGEKFIPAPPSPAAPEADPDTVFAGFHLSTQLRLAVVAIDRAEAALKS